MSDMIKRVAKAINECLVGDYDGWPVWEDEAKAALKSLTPSDLAALAEPMGLAVVPLESNEDIGNAWFRSIALMPEEIVSGEDYQKSSEIVYKAMIEAGRIKPEKETADE